MTFPPLLKKWLKRLLKWLKRLLIAVFVLFTLGVLLLVFENWRAKRDWLAYKAEWEAKGERFDRAAFLPPDVPDDQNIAATPLLAPLLDWEPAPPDPLSHSGTPPLPEAVSDGVVRVYDWLRLVGVGGGFMESRLSKLALVEPPVRGVDTNMLARYGLPPEAVEALMEEAKSKARPILVGPSQAEIKVILSNPSRSVAANVLAVFDLFSAEMDELAEASEQPYLVMGSRKSDAPVSDSTSKLSVVRNVANAFRVRALARLTEKDSAGAISDIGTVLRLGKAMRSEPLLITGLVRLAVLSSALQPIWEGLARHQWSDAQLRLLDLWLWDQNVVSEAGMFLRAERAYSLGFVDLMLRSPKELKQIEPGLVSPSAGMLPNAVIYRNELAIARMFQEDLLPMLDPREGTVDIAAAMKAEDPEMKAPTKVPPILANPYSVFADSLRPAIGPAVEKFALVQAQVVMARVASALERHRLAAGDLPSDLQALIPDYLPALPLDPAGGGSLHYRRLSEDNFLLYSAGPNALDDGGKVVRRDNRNDSVDLWSNECDWVWTYPSGE